MLVGKGKGDEGKKSRWVKPERKGTETQKGEENERDLGLWNPNRDRRVLNPEMSERREKVDNVGGVNGEGHWVGGSREGTEGTRNEIKKSSVSQKGKEKGSLGYEPRRYRYSAKDT